MRIKHRVPIREPISAIVDEAYQREVDRSTQRGEKAYAQVLHRLQVAERKAEKAAKIASRTNATRKDEKALAVAVALVEVYRVELSTYERLMKTSPSSATHRGRKSFGPVPKPGDFI